MAMRRSGFTVVEVTMASAILLLALTGVMGGAFAVLRSAGATDLVAQAANLASERLAYFRACPNPFIAVGGTYYPPPINPRMERDHNDPNEALSRNDLHNIMNENPVLLVREYLFDTAESRYMGADGLDQGRVALFRKHRPRAANQQEELRNVIPPLPNELLVGTNRCTVAGVYPNWGREAATAARPAPQAYELPITRPQMADQQTRWIAFLPAPRANDHLRGDNAVLDPQVKFVREVWVQSNTPLGAPFINLGDQLVLGQTRNNPTYYGGTNVPPAARVADFARISTANLANGQFTVPVPMWTMTVTVRVFRREPQVRIVRNAANAGVDRTTTGNWSGLGYDPARPLATIVGYFGLRRTLRY
jgi:type II secretory pathway pseudopilin PulG